jgi:hypothetical protein
MPMYPRRVRQGFSELLAVGQTILLPPFAPHPDAVVAYLESSRGLRVTGELYSPWRVGRTFGCLSVSGTFSPSFLPPGMCHSMTWFISAPTSMMSAE